MVRRRGHSLVELLVALTVLGVGLGAVSAASVFAMRSTNDALLRERAVILGVGTLDSLTALRAPGGGTRHVSGIRMEWVVDASTDGGDIHLSAWPESSRRWTERLHARFLAPLPVLAP